MRSRSGYEETDHQNYHRIALAFDSDRVLAGLVLNKYPDFKVGLVTSLDHSMWFHVPLEAGKWYLHDNQLQNTVDGRTLNSSRYSIAIIMWQSQV